MALVYAAAGAMPPPACCPTGSYPERHWKHVAGTLEAAIYFGVQSLAVAILAWTSHSLFMM